MEYCLCFDRVTLFSFQSSFLYPFKGDGSTRLTPKRIRSSMKTCLSRILTLILFLTGLVLGCAPEATIEKHPQRFRSSPRIDYHHMVLIPSGEFLMGSTPENVKQAKTLFREETGREPLDIWFEDETPPHTVYLDAFYIDKYEVTNQQYREFVEATNYKRPFNWMDAYFRQPDKPVMGIEWIDAQSYAQWAGKRLPTEAEWEKAARGSLAGRLFSWGDEPPQISRKNNDYVPGKREFSTGDWEYHFQVGSDKPNGYGIYETTSNVYEWCNDWYAPDYYKYSPPRNPPGPKDGASKVVRGGSWFHGSFDLRCAYRNINPPYNRSYYIGFRCVRTAPAEIIEPIDSSASKTLPLATFFSSFQPRAVTPRLRLACDSSYLHCNFWSFNWIRLEEESIVRFPSLDIGCLSSPKHNLLINLDIQ